MNRAQWLKQSLEYLDVNGPEALTLRPLTRALGVTTGSFYAHFKNRAHFFDTLIAYWADTFTEAHIARVDTLSGTPKDKLRQLMLFVYTNDATRYDVAIRNWARRDATIAEKLKQVECFRLDIIRQLLADIGFADVELDCRAHLCLCYMSSNRLVYNGLSEEKTALQLDIALQLITQRLPLMPKQEALDVRT